MSEDAKNFIDSIDKGILPPLNIQTTEETVGLGQSERGIDKTVFGLQRLNEQVDPKK